MFIQAGVAIMTAWWMCYLTSFIISACMQHLRSELPKTKTYYQLFIDLLHILVNNLKLGLFDKQCDNNPPYVHLDNDQYWMRVNIIIVMQEAIVWLSDTQTFFGISYLAAAITQAKYLDIFHMTFIHQISWLPSQAHEVALSYAITGCTPYFFLRIWGILLFMTLFVIFEALYIWRLIVDYNSVNPCYADATSVTWVVANIVLTLWSYWPVVQFYRHREQGEVQHSDDQQDSDFQLFQSVAYRYRCNGNCSGSKRGALYSLRRYKVSKSRPRTEVYLVPYQLGARAGSACASNMRTIPQRSKTVAPTVGNNEQREPLVMTRLIIAAAWKLIQSKEVSSALMASWFAYQIQESATLRSLYVQYILDGSDENEWGFGQVISILVLFTTGFQFYKSYRSLSPNSFHQFSSLLIETRN